MTTQIKSKISVLKALVKLFSLVALLFGCSNDGFGQAPRRALAPGDTLPHYALGEGFNFKEETLAGLTKGKVTILYMWATYCAPCLEKLPVLDSLRSKYKEELQVIAVGYEGKSKIEKALSRTVVLEQLKMPVIVDDSLMTFGWFPHRTVPHLVIVNDSGKIVSITGDDRLTEANIKKLIRGEHIGFLDKQQELSFDVRKPFDPVRQNAIYRSILLKFIYGAPSGGSILPKAPTAKFNRKIQRIAFANYSIVNMLMSAAFHGRVKVFNRNFLALEVTDSTRYFPPAGFPAIFENQSGYATLTEWQAANLYCYELSLNEEVDESVFFNRMLFELNGIFGIRGGIEKRKRRCYVIHALPESKKYISSNGEPTLLESSHPENIGGIKHVKMAAFVRFLNAFNTGIPIASAVPDNIAYTFMTEIPLMRNGQDHVDIVRLGQELKKIGFELKEEEFLVDILVVKDGN